MGVRCKLLGHVHDSTEFEERQEERPNGTVLICREYQICRRCGDRKELYRNEQVLTPETADADSSIDESANDTDTDVDEGETPQSGDEGAEPHEESEPDGQDTAATPDPDRSENEGDGGTEAAGEDQPDTGEQSSDESREQETPDAADADPVTDDAVILSNSPSDATPSTGNTPDETESDGADNSWSASDGGGSPSFDVGGDDPSKLGCMNCGREWRRDGTSLREGDLCPGCREAYVEGV